MLPKWHILLGLIFSMLIYFILNITLLQASLIFLASVFIDIDHYLFYIRKRNNYSLRKAYFWHKNLPKNHKPIMHFFHTIEFTFLILIMSYFWQGFIFILIGMLVHSILDLLEFIHEGYLGREFSFIRYLIRNKNNPDKYF